MVDDELAPWIIEINHLPSFRSVVAGFGLRKEGSYCSRRCDHASAVVGATTDRLSQSVRGVARSRDGRERRALRLARVSCFSEHLEHVGNG